MKENINVLCVIIIVCLSALIFESSYSLGSAFYSGFSVGVNTSEMPSSTALDNSHPVILGFIPNSEQVINPTDSIQFSMEKFPICYEKNTIYIPNSIVPKWSMVIGLVGYVAILASWIIMIVSFIQLIININKNKIFIVGNHKKLKIMAKCFLLIASIQIGLGLCDEYIVNSLNYEMTGYNLTAYWTMPWTELIIGFISSLIAVIWKKAIRLYDENTFTI